jgi:hypothetical protein
MREKDTLLWHSVGNNAFSAAELLYHSFMIRGSMFGARPQPMLQAFQ